MPGLGPGIHEMPLTPCRFLVDTRAKPGQSDFGKLPILVVHNAPLSGRHPARYSLGEVNTATMPLRIRHATVADVDAVAAVFSASLRLLTFLPMLHTVAEDRSFIANVIFRDCEVIVAEDNSGVVAFLARQGEEVRLLYTRHDRIGRGAGTLLIEAAKRSGVNASNRGAFRPMRVLAASMKREASVRSALPTGRTTRRKRLTSATAGNLAPAVDARPAAAPGT